MNFAPLEAWLAAHTGLVAGKLGPGQVARIAQERVRVTRSENLEAYVAFLATSTAEQLQFIEAIVVAETWFFRDRAALDGLVRHVTQPWAARHADAAFRMLSVPCSTGEEPYSIAMALALASWPAARLQIDAVDISRENVVRAAEGIYRRNSFRGADIAFREIFFDPLPDEVWSVREGVRRPVRLQEANLLADGFAIGRPLYDAIFCRNLLIYFDPPVQTRVFRTLARLLSDDGLLAVGPAEAVLALEHGFSPVPGESMFLFQKAAPKSPAVRPPPARPRVRAAVPPAAAPVAAKRPAQAVPRAPQPAVAAVASPSASLEKLRGLADAGRLREARELGQALLRDGGASIELCYLLAVVADAGGDARHAEEFYRKTLYLDPKHAESLAHLALILEKKGDARGAATLRTRARRAAGAAAPGTTAKEVA